MFSVFYMHHGVSIFLEALQAHASSANLTNNTKDMIDEATLVLQRWTESDSLPSGMVFDAEHLDTTKLVKGLAVEYTVL